MKWHDPRNQLPKRDDGQTYEKPMVKMMVMVVVMMMMMVVMVMVKAPYPCRFYDHSIRQQQSKARALCCRGREADV